MLIKKEMMKKNKFFAMVIFGLMLALPLVSAGVGISWTQESSLVPENTKTCLIYKVYNPWPEDSYVQITLSEELMEIVSSSESDITFIPKGTSSADAIPVEFCFKTPRVYEEDCWIGNKLICKQECVVETKSYAGEVEVMEASSSELEGGAGGSATAMAVSAPLRVKVQCVPHSRNYTLIYIIVGVIAGILLAINLLKKKKKKK